MLALQFAYCLGREPNRHLDGNRGAVVGEHEALEGLVPQAVVPYRRDNQPGHAGCEVLLLGDDEARGLDLGERRLRRALAPALLDRLVTEKLEHAAGALRAEGWKWIEIVPEIDYQRIRGMARAHPERSEPSEEQQAEIDRLSEAYDALVAAHGEEPPDGVAAELEDLSDRIDTLSEGAVVWDPEGIARSGAIVGVGLAGRAVVERGLLRREDEAVGAPETTTGNDRPGGSRARRQKDGASPLPDRLVEDLTAHRTAALRVVLADNSEMSLIAVVHALALSLLYQHGADSCLAIRVDSADLSGSAQDIEESRAAKALADRHDAWRLRLPAAAEDVWEWLLGQETAVRLDLLAHCASCAVNAVRRPHEDVSSGQLVHADQLAGALELDMAEWWQPTAASYLGRIPKARILEAVSEGVSREAAENLAKLKKDALVSLAEERLAGTRWLPSILRSSVPL
jgi:ParB family transcriptional regulator, chromosome partitioning protein